MRTFHIPGVPHTRPTPAFSHCAFTTKTRLLPRLLKLAYPDCKVHYYGIENDIVEGADMYTPIMSEWEWGKCFGAHHENPRAFVGDLAGTDHPGYRIFNDRLGNCWSAWLDKGDVVCFPFGHAHSQAWSKVTRTDVIGVETGIGYPHPFLKNRIYESYAWLHYVAGKERGYKLGHQDGFKAMSGRDGDFGHITPCEGSDYHFVAPHYYDRAEWWRERGEHRTSDDIVYMGRLSVDKGLDVIRAIADAMPDRHFVMYGQGDPSRWEGRNLRYGGVLTGTARRDVLMEAKLVLCPSRYIEPFCQTHVEALLCGTPVVASHFGVFAEHARNHHITGLYTARTLDEWVREIDSSSVAWNTEYTENIEQNAAHVFSLEAVAPLYRYAIDTMLQVLEPHGWFGSHFPSRSTE